MTVVNPACSPAGPIVARAALLLACLAVLAAVAAAAPLAAAGWPYAELLRWPFSLACHQLPERSFHWLGSPLAVCQRCTGLYLGFALGLAAWPHLPASVRRVATRPAWLATCLALLALDWALPNSSASRFATGLLGAFPIGLLAHSALPHFTNKTNPSKTDSGRRPAWTQPSSVQR